MAIGDLFKLYLNNNCNGKELDQLIEYFGTTDEIILRELISSAMEEKDNSDLSQHNEKLSLIYQGIHEDIQSRTPSHQRTVITQFKSIWFKIAAAASILLFLSIGIYFLRHSEKPTKQIVKNQIHDIGPGGNKAVLTLADGKKIVLTDARNGTLAKQGAAQVNKTGDGQLAYAMGEKPSPRESDVTKFNLIETPRGGKYIITLSDGSKAWLDAASSIRFPVVFTGDSREVTTTGQVYFEVVHDAAMPFRVTTRGQTIEVLGTHFNINAYPDEPVIKTTLLEGSVKIMISGHSAMLNPGQQSAVTGEDNKIDIKNTDVDEVIAWKNGYFVFENENIHSIMRKLRRWYDVEPDFAANVSEIGFGGTVSRSKNISEVLKVLELTKGVHFKIEGRRIKVMP